MDPMKLLEAETELDWSYDAEADALYVSFGAPREAVGIDIGDGVIVRYDEQAAEVVGLTVIGLRSRTERRLVDSSGV